MAKVGRNDPCPCGSGKKFKKCHGGPIPPPPSGRRWHIEKISEASPEIQAIAQKHRKEAIASSFSGPEPIKLDSRGYTFRAIKNRLYYRKSYKTYPDFLLDLVKFAFGPKWHKAQVETPVPERHVVMQWMGTLYRHRSAMRPKDAPEKAVFETSPIGDGQALVTLADDLYRLQLAGILTSRLMRRLRVPEEFQGARYEIQVASIFLRSGFDIEWATDDVGKHCEFYAVHRHSRQRVAVEAKSRKRPGILGAKGEFRKNHPFGVESLYEDARRQNPGGCAFCIFVDVNWPPHPELPRLGKPWMREIFRMVEKHVPAKEDPDNVTLEAFTNYAWHYQGPGPALPHETLFFLPVFTTYPFADPLVRDALARSIATYGVRIEESPTPMIEDDVLEQLAGL
jgi:SEC-C motif